MRFVISRCGALLALALAVVLGGCGNFDFESAQWFAKPMDVFGRNSGYNFSELQSTREQRPIAENELVQQSGVCPPPPAGPQAQAPLTNATAATNPGVMPTVASDADTLLGGGIALAMSECGVVYRAGQPSAVQIGRSPNGDRTAVLTFLSGPRPGTYRFERGRLVEIDRVDQPAPPPEAAKKKPKTKKPAKSNAA